MYVYHLPLLGKNQELGKTLFSDLVGSARRKNIYRHMVTVNDQIRAHSVMRNMQTTVKPVIRDHPREGQKVDASFTLYFDSRDPVKVDV